MLKLDQQHVQAFVDYYNRDFSAYGDEVYADVRSRIAHWVNFQNGGWFADRLNIFLNRVEHLQAHSLAVVDLGFSVPYAYSRANIASSRQTRFLFVDKEASTLQFYNALVENQGQLFRTPLDTLLLADIETPRGADRVAAAAKGSLINGTPPDNLLILCSEVIEHLRKPDRAWQLMRKLVTTFHGTRHEIHLTLPIGQIIPSHTMSFETADSAKAYVDRHMNVTHWSVLQPGPHDLKSEFLTHCVYAQGTLVSE